MLHVRFVCLIARPGAIQAGKDSGALNRFEFVFVKIIAVPMLRAEEEPVLSLRADCFSFLQVCTERRHACARPVEAVVPGEGLLLAFNSSIFASGGITNATPELDLGAQLITLLASLLSAENQLQERCTALLRGDFSSFISIGRGGTEPAPEELQTTF
jgi:hypothetical protein